MNFGLCTPTDAVKMMTKDIRYPLIRSGTPHVICDDDNHQSNVQAAVCEEQLILPRYKHDNTITAGANIDTYDSLNGTMITSHGLMDDIERYFTSADGWDKTESPRSTRLYSEEESHCPREYHYDSTSSTSDKNTIIYIDSTIKDMYPFLSTPTPQTPGSLFSPLTGTLLVGRTSSLPIPCTQDGYSRHARMTNSRPICIPIIDNNERGAKVRSDVSEDFAVRNKEPFTSIVGPDACGSYLGKSEIDQRTGWCPANQKTLTRREEALSLSNSDVYNYDEPIQSLMSNKSSSAAKKGSRGRTLKSSQCDREPDIQHDSHDMKTGSRRGRTKRSPVTLSDTLLLSHATVSPNGEIPGLLEDFLSSNYFIKDDFNDSTSPFFMQQSFQCYPKAQSIEELLAKSTSLGIDPITGSVRSSSKKRYRKHQASVSVAKKFKVPSSVDDDKNWATSLRKKILDVQVPCESVMYGLREVGPDDDDRMAGVYCEGTHIARHFELFVLNL